MTDTMPTIATNGRRAIVTNDKPGHGGAYHAYLIVDSATGDPIASVSFQNGPEGEYGINGVQHVDLLAIIQHRMDWQKLTAGQTELPIKRLMRSWLDTGENPVMKGAGFMGHEWDALVPPPNTWAALWRVMKPGAYLLAFGGTRTYDLITMSIRFAAFDVDDQIATCLQGQGMVKRVRLGLKIDDHYEKS